MSRAQEGGFKVVEDPRLLRMAVSLTPEPEHHLRWARIGEGYSVRLASELLARCGPKGSVIDPFAGTGTTLVAAAAAGWSGTGIELLPFGELRFEWLRSWKHARIDEIAALAEMLRCEGGWRCTDAHLVPYKVANMLRPHDLAQAIALKTFIARIESFPEKAFIQAAGLQALRDQTRSFEPVLRTARGGRWKTRTDKRSRYDCLENAFGMRLFKMTLQLLDAQERDALADLKEQRMVTGSALDVLPAMEEGSFDAAVTSPPYFDGFDYADEYLLDHWFLGLDPELIDSREGLIPTRFGGAPEVLGDDDAFDRYLDLQRRVLREVARVVRRGGTVLYVLDDALVDGDEVNMGIELMDTALSAGLEPVAEYRYSGKRASSGLTAERERTAVYRWERV